MHYYICIRDRTIIIDYSINSTSNKFKDKAIKRKYKYLITYEIYVDIAMNLKKKIQHNY